MSSLTPGLFMPYVTEQKLCVPMCLFLHVIVLNVCFLKHTTVQHDHLSQPCPDFPTVCPQAVSAIWFTNKRHWKVCPTFTLSETLLESTAQLLLAFCKKQSHPKMTVNNTVYLVFSFSFELQPLIHLRSMGFLWKHQVSLHLYSYQLTELDCAMSAGLSWYIQKMLSQF